MIIYLVWYVVILGIGIAYMPLSMMLFDGWNDRGWIFSKSLGVMIGAYTMWVMNCLHLARFRTLPCFLFMLIPAAVFAFLYSIYAKRHDVSSRYTYRERRAIANMAAHKISGAFPFKLILAEEAAFFLIMALWVYIIGFRPEAYGTEKFMDYGFITSMLRSDYMPFADPWYAGKAVNYYYGGQYITAWLIRLSQVRAGEGYNLMRAFVAAMSFFLPYSLASQMLTDRMIKWNPGRRGAAREAAAADKYKEAEKADRISASAILAGITAGCAVAFCGNFHYVIFGLIVPAVQKIKGEATIYRYWFPESTRYIGYNPDTPDKTIHEFPSYSTVLGDLHAHYINILLVVLVTAVVYSWARRRFLENERLQFKENLFERTASGRNAGGENTAEQIHSLLLEIFHPEILLIGFMTGLFRWTNFWDFPIYYVVCGSVIFFVNLRKYRKTPKFFWIVMLAEAAVMFLTGKIAALPFTATFDQISSEIGVTSTHTAFYQLVILWWLPVAVSVWFIAARIRERVLQVRKQREELTLGEKIVGWENRILQEETDSPESPESNGKPVSREDRAEENKAAKIWKKVRKALAKALTAFLNFFENLTLPDMTAVLFAACAMGLVWLPEVIYVKDIYIATHYRANTMFKLTYQAFILFGIVMGYVLIRAVSLRGRELAADEYGEDGAGQNAGKSVFGILSRSFAILGLCVLVLTGGYIFRSVHDWFGNIFVAQERISTDASVFISESFPNDYEAVAWLNTHVTGQPVILEANGDSYSDYERVSVATGLPTVMGWYVHEWLWRNNTEEQNIRSEDIKAIYTSNDEEMVRALIREYDIEYIYIGTLERQKFENLNDALLQKIGEVAYSDGKTTYIMKVG